MKAKPSTPVKFVQKRHPEARCVKTFWAALSGEIVQGYIVTAPGGVILGKGLTELSAWMEAARTLGSKR